jgi:hypothetical protein
MYNCEITNNYCFLANSLMNGLYLSTKGELEKHKNNVKVYLANPAGIGEHSDISDTLLQELDKIANAEDRLSVIKKHFYDYDNNNLKLILNKCEKK